MKAHQFVARMVIGGFVLLFLILLIGGTAKAQIVDASTPIHGYSHFCPAIAIYEFRCISDTGQVFCWAKADSLAKERWVVSKDSTEIWRDVSPCTLARLKYAKHDAKTEEPKLIITKHKNGISFNNRYNPKTFRGSYSPTLHGIDAFIKDSSQTNP